MDSNILMADVKLKFCSIHAKFVLVFTDSSMKYTDNKIVKKGRLIIVYFCRQCKIRDSP